MNVLTIIKMLAWVAFLVSLLIACGATAIGTHAAWHGRSLIPALGWAFVMNTMTCAIGCLCLMLQLATYAKDALDHLYRIGVASARTTQSLEQRRKAAIHRNNSLAGLHKSE